MPPIQTRVPSTPADANINVRILPTVAGELPTVAEATAATAADISCYLTPDGFNFSSEQATISDERLCSAETFGAPGRTTYSLDLTGIDNTGNPDLEDEYNLLADTLVEGKQIFVARRQGRAFDDEYAANQTVRIIPAIVGKKQELPPEANSVLKSKWQLFVNGPSVIGKISA